MAMHAFQIIDSLIFLLVYNITGRKGNRRAEILRNKTVISLLIVTLMIFSGTATSRAIAYERHGAQIDRVRVLAIENEGSQFSALKQGEIDFSPDIILPSAVESLIREGYLVTSTPGFHLWFVGFNLRRPFLSDVKLKHALFHAYNQEEIIASIYRYTVTPVQSIVPPAQGEWVNPMLPKHPYDPGNVGDMYPAQHTTFGIMAAAGYTYVGTGYGDLTAHWEKNGVSLPTWKLLGPSYEFSPNFFYYGEAICDEWKRCGFNNIIHVPVDMRLLTKWVYYDRNFDMFMMFRSLGDFPLQLHSMTHTSVYGLGDDNCVGLNDPILDDLVQAVMCSLDHEVAVAAAWEAQERLYDPQYPQALPFMALYSRIYFDAARQYLDGVVNSPGYGSDNFWTWLSWHWNTADGMHPGTGDSSVIYCNYGENGEELQTLNPLASSTTFDAKIWQSCYDSGIQMDPYTHTDVVWQYSEYPIIAGPITEVTPNGVKIVDGMSITSKIRDDIYWQDGNKFEADDAIFSLNFLRNNQIPQYVMTWQDIADIYKVDQLTFKVWSNNTSPRYVYYWDKGAYLCPPQVWSWLDGAPLATILSYDPAANTTDTGPWSYPLTPNGPKTQLFGTGPFVFDSYDPLGMYADLHNWDADGINKGYFKTTAEIVDTLADLFHSRGDIDRDGSIWASDKHAYGLSFGRSLGQAEYNPDADLNVDGMVDWEDGAVMCASWGKKKEYTKP
jgi:peptide/nickel transport system substrate-binding protein